MVCVDEAKRRFARGVDQFRAGDYSAAETDFRQALLLGPPRASVLTNLANSLLAQGRAIEAAQFAQRSVELDGTSADAWFVLGRCLRDEPSRALDCFDRVIALSPGWAMARFLRATALNELQREPEALSEYEASTRLDPHLFAAWLDRGVLLSELKRYPEAIACFAQALALDPDNADAHWNESHVRLLLGQYDLGWEKFAYRWKYSRAERPRYVERPLRSLDDAKPGTCILLWAEQGYGDAIHFCRYAKRLADRGARVYLEVQPPLRELLGSLGVHRVIALGERVPPFDFQAPILDLPRLFGGAADAIRWPAAYLSSDPELTSRWRARLGAQDGSARDGEVRIALSCAGNSRHGNDRRRSMPLAALKHVTGRARFYLIQKELREVDAATAAAMPNLRIVDKELLQTFADSAAIVANMDLVISVDTSLAHLAGALGKPVWILLPWAPEWRWMLERADCPWYPTATLFRQEAEGDWEGVMRRVGSALEAFVSAQPPRAVP